MVILAVCVWHCVVIVASLLCLSSMGHLHGLPGPVVPEFCFCTVWLELIADVCVTGVCMAGVHVADVCVAGVCMADVCVAVCVADVCVADVYVTDVCAAGKISL